MAHSNSKLRFSLAPPAPANDQYGHILPCTALIGRYSSARDGSLVDHTAHTRIQLHSDWINDIAILNTEKDMYTGIEEEELVVTASSDNSVKFWNSCTDQHGVIGAHSDYVKAITVTAGIPNTVFSAGLDGKVKKWVLAGKKEGKYIWLQRGEWAGQSIYAIASHGTTIAVGDLQGTITLFDGGSMTVLASLKSHSDVVKCIRLTENHIISGGSDQSLMVLSFETKELAKKYSFDESIWCFDLSGDYVGGSNGSIWKLPLIEAGEKPAVVYKGESGVLSLAVSNSGIHYSTTSSSTIRFYPIKNFLPTEDTWSLPPAEIVGHPALIRAKFLSGKRHVLTLSTSNEVQLWDLLTLSVKETLQLLPGQDLDVVGKQFETFQVTSEWCSVTVKAGHLIVEIRENKLTEGEVYADELRDHNLQFDDSDMSKKDAKRDRTVSMARVFLKSIFADFINFEQQKDLELRQKREIARVQNELGKKDKKPKLKIRTILDSASASNMESPSEEKKSKKFWSRRSRSSSTVPTSVNPKPDDSSNESAPTTANTTADSNFSSSETEPEHNPLPPVRGTVSALLADISRAYDGMRSWSGVSLIRPASDPITTHYVSLSAEEKQRIQLFISGDSAASYSEDLTHILTNDRKDMESIERKLPLWLGEFLLKDVYHVKQLPTYHFSLSREKSSDSPALKGQTQQQDQHQSQPEQHHQQKQPQAANAPSNSSNDPLNQPPHQSKSEQAEHHRDTEQEFPPQASYSQFLQVGPYPEMKANTKGLNTDTKLQNPPLHSPSSSRNSSGGSSFRDRRSESPVSPRESRIGAGDGAFNVCPKDSDKPLNSQDGSQHPVAPFKSMLLGSPKLESRDEKDVPPVSRGEVHKGDSMCDPQPNCSENDATNDPKDGALESTDHQTSNAYETATEFEGTAQNTLNVSSRGMTRMREVLRFLCQRLDINAYVDGKEGLDDEERHRLREYLTLDNVEEWLELTCNGKPVDNEMSLTTLRFKVWKGSGEMPLAYRIRGRNEEGE